jgi:hypothetical protein
VLRHDALEVLVLFERPLASHGGTASSARFAEEEGKRRTWA